MKLSLRAFFGVQLTNGLKDNGASQVEVTADGTIDVVSDKLLAFDEDTECRAAISDCRPRLHVSMYSQLRLNQTEGYGKPMGKEYSGEKMKHRERLAAALARCKAICAQADKCIAFHFLKKNRNEFCNFYEEADDLNYEPESMDFCIWQPKLPHTADVPVCQPGNGLKVEYFEFPPGQQIPNLTDKTPKLVALEPEINFPANGPNSDEGWCTNRLCDFQDVNFVLRWTGFIEIKSAGYYEFSTKSDDGSWMSLNGELLINHGGYHGMTEQTGSIELEAVQHPIEITYSQAGDYWGMVWKYKGPDTADKWIVVPQGVLFQPTY